MTVRHSGLHLIINSLPTRAVGDLVAYVGAEKYEIVTSVADPLTNILMVDLEASGLSVVPFGASGDIEAGDLAFIVAGSDVIVPTSVVRSRNWTNEAALAEAEEFTTEFLFSDDAL